MKQILVSEEALDSIKRMAQRDKRCLVWCYWKAMDALVKPNITYDQWIDAIEGELAGSMISKVEQERPVFDNPKISGAGTASA